MSVKATKQAKSAGRPRSFNEDEALDKAMLVFWEKGFEGASLNHLTRAMSIKPASLYGAFGNKEELFRRVLERYKVQQVVFVAEALAKPTAYEVAEQILRGMAVFLTRPGYPPGCLMIQTSLAASDHGAVIHEELSTLRINAQKTLQKRFTRAKKEGDLPETASPESLARFIVAVYQGMGIQSVSGATRKELLDLAETAMRAWPAS